MSLHLPTERPAGHRGWLTDAQDIHLEVTFRLMDGEVFDAVIVGVYDDCVIVEPTSLGKWADIFGQRVVFYHAIAVMDAKRP